jgi:hypothetical protein
MSTPTAKLPFIEDRIVSQLVAALKRAGWKLDSIYSDDDWTRGWVPATRVAAIKEELYQLSDVWVRFKRGERSHQVRLIAGNGCDLISDYTYARDSDPDDFDQIMEAICDRVERTYA